MDSIEDAALISLYTSKEASKRKEKSTGKQVFM